jgi:hypothetical protein
MDFFNKIGQGFTDTIIKPSETFFNKTIPEKVIQPSDNFFNQVGHSLPPSITGAIGIHSGTVRRPNRIPVAVSSPNLQPSLSGKPITHTVLKNIDDPNTNNYMVPLIIGGVLIAFMVMKN